MHNTSTNHAKVPGWLEIRGRDCLVRIRIQPRSSREGFDGVRDGRLLVRVCTPPVGGAANERLIRILSHALGVPKNDVCLIRGEKSRHKDVLIRGGAAAGAQRLAQF